MLTCALVPTKSDLTKNILCVCVSAGAVAAALDVIKDLLLQLPALLLLLRDSLG